MTKLIWWWHTFHRKFWRWVFNIARKRVQPLDIAEVMDEQWWNLVRYRMTEIGRSELGLGLIEVLFLDNEGESIERFDRDVRDIDRDVRSDRMTT